MSGHYGKPPGLGQEENQAPNQQNESTLPGWGKSEQGGDGFGNWDVNQSGDGEGQGNCEGQGNVDDGNADDQGEQAGQQADETEPTEPKNEGNEEANAENGAPEQANEW